MTDDLSPRCVAFLDTNVILECKLLDELPWDEIDADGPILLLVTPTTLKEIDAKKRDGRLGPIARAFNRLIAPAALGGDPVIVQEAEPRVAIDASSSTRIPWDDLDDLDPDLADDRITAEALYAKGLPDVPVYFVGQDIQPLAAATRAGLNAKRVDENWLRPKEPSPQDKEIQRLKARVRTFEQTEPSFEIDVEITPINGAELIQLSKLSDEEKEALRRRIIALNSKQRQARNPYDLNVGLSGPDHGYGDRYDEWRSKRLPAFLDNYETEVSAFLNQARFRLAIENTGSVQAENLLIDVSINHGWFNEKVLLVSPQGPPAPRPRLHIDLLGMQFPNLAHSAFKPGLHDMHSDPDPERSPYFSVQCADFRHGAAWSFDGIVSMDAFAPDAIEVSVSVTASNYKGTAAKSLLADWPVREAALEELIDPHEVKFIVATPVDNLLDAQKFDEIDLGDHADDD